MFFMRLRRGTKPIFIFLALVFAASFVFLGVGSGSSGIGDLLRGNFHFGGGSSGPSIGKAQAKIKKNPNDAAAYLEQLPLSALPDDARGLLNLCYSLINVAFPIEAWRQPRVPDSGASSLELVVEPAV